MTLEARGLVRLGRQWSADGRLVRYGDIASLPWLSGALHEKPVTLLPRCARGLAIDPQKDRLLEADVGLKYWGDMASIQARDDAVPMVSMLHLHQ